MTIGKTDTWLIAKVITVPKATGRLKRTENAFVMRCAPGYAASPARHVCLSALTSESDRFLLPFKRIKQLACRACTWTFLGSLPSRGAVSRVEATHGRAPGREAMGMARVVFKYSVFVVAAVVTVTTKQKN